MWSSQATRLQRSLHGEGCATGATSKDLRLALGPRLHSAEGRLSRMREQWTGCPRDGVWTGSSCIYKVKTPNILVLKAPPLQPFAETIKGLESCFMSENSLAFRNVNNSQPPSCHLSCHLTPLPTPAPHPHQVHLGLCPLGACGRQLQAIRLYCRTHGCHEPQPLKHRVQLRRRTRRPCGGRVACHGIAPGVISGQQSNRNRLDLPHVRHRVAGANLNGSLCLCSCK